MATQSLSALRGITAGQPPLWVSGSTVAQWQYRTSPLDGERYQRKTATGSGTTDPADDTTNYVADSFNRPLPISNPWSGGGAPIVQNGLVYSSSGLVGVGPALSAGVRTSILSVTGKGRLNVGMLHSTYSGTRTVRSELIVDGRALFDATTSFSGSNAQRLMYNGMIQVDSATGNVYVTAQQPIEFARSLQIWQTSSVASGANTTTTYYSLDLRG